MRSGRGVGLLGQTLGSCFEVELRCKTVGSAVRLSCGVGL